MRSRQVLVEVVWRAWRRFVDFSESDRQVATAYARETCGFSLPPQRSAFVNWPPVARKVTAETMGAAVLNPGDFTKFKKQQMARHHRNSSRAESISPSCREHRSLLMLQRSLAADKKRYCRLVEEIWWHDLRWRRSMPRAIVTAAVLLSTLWLIPASPIAPAVANPAAAPATVTVHLPPGKVFGPRLVATPPPQGWRLR